MLYGPPGTGKTWSTVSHAVAIVEGLRVEDVEKRGRDSVKAKFDEYRFNDHREIGQIAMVTFHQNYAYEDFMEGIRPHLDGSEAEGMGYVLSHGPLRKLAAAAQRNLERSGATGVEDWKAPEMVQGFLEWVKTETDAGRTMWLAKGAGGSDIVVTGVYEGRQGDISGVQLGGATTQKLFRRVLERDYVRFLNRDITSYTEIRRTMPGTSPWHGQAIYFFELLKLVKRYHEKEWTPPPQESVDRKNFVLIIDEINRGNIARIFGELITLVEDSRRIGGSDETRVTLPYSGDEFGVPENLYIIGTMNTADRSIALLDTALRRRFEFVEMMPQPDHEKVSDNADGVDCRRLLRAMNDRIRFLLDREHQIGHTYFLDVENIEGLKDAFQKQIVPLLQEYFYDDWAKIDAVLGGNGFVRPVPCPEELKEEGLVDADARAWELAPFKDERWGEADAYRKIYAGKADKGTAPAGGGQQK